MHKEKSENLCGITINILSCTKINLSVAADFFYPVLITVSRYVKLDLYSNYPGGQYMDEQLNNRQIMVIGHRNPDTDSVCSAIAYANLKNKISDREYVPARAGEINQETEFVLDRFNVPLPRRVLNVYAQVRDMDIRPVEGVSGDMTLRKAWETIRDNNITSLPITRPDNTLEGLITLQDIALANMDKMDVYSLGQAGTKISSIIATLKGTLVVGDPDKCITKGKIVVGAGSPDVLETSMEDGDIVILADRYDSQLCAVEMNASCIIVCLAPTITKTITKLARDHGCAIISTPYDTYTTSCLINHSIPIRHYMKKDLLKFKLTTPVENVKKVMGQVRYNYFPVLDGDSKYVGVISRRNFLNLQRKQLVLVDHNEKTQCVDGIEQAEVLEIIDHHRVGSLETTGPVYFRNQPVGCTATIIYEMYRENRIEIEPDIAGILCCAILSDTLAFRSPTCTKPDEDAAHALADIAGVDIDTIANEMFEAGENIANKTPDEIFLQDYKVFVHDDIHFGVGQGSYMNKDTLNSVREIIEPHLQSVLQREKLDMVFYLLTSVTENTSRVIFAGDEAKEVLRTAFDVEPQDGTVVLDGIVSRKKQFIPAMINALQQMR